MGQKMNDRIRLEIPHITPKKRKRSPNKSVKKQKLDLKRFKKEVGQHFYYVKGQSVSFNRYKFFTQEEKDKRKAQVKARRERDPKVRKQESRQQLIRRAIKLGKFRTCSKCGESKPYIEFDRKHEKRLNKRHTRRSYCKSCRSIMNRENYLKRKEKMYDT